MFVDDLILVTKVSRLSAHNCLSYLNIYCELTGHKPNMNKSALYLPLWLNKQVAKSICSILVIKLDNFPFNYLGVSISPNRLSVNNFNFLINRVDATIKS